MNFDFSEDQNTLREHARRFLTETATFSRLRGVLEGGTGIDTELWRQLVELGWTGTAIPESDGGLGMGALELCVLCEELGRVVPALPFFSTVCVAAEILKRCETPAAKALLQRIAQDGTVVVFAGAERSWDWSLDGLQTRLESGRLTGRKEPIADLPHAEVIIVSAMDEQGRPCLALLDADADGVSVQRMKGFDDLRPHGLLTVEAAKASLLISGEEARTILSQVLDQASVFAAFEQIGGAEAACLMARDYVMQRFAFGRQVATNQAVKHKLADTLVKIEIARSNAYYGAWAIEAEAETIGSAAAAARLSATDAFNYSSEECLHLHGGFGYTWEADCHFYYRRARLLSVSLGNCAWWSDRLVDSHVAAKPAA